MLRKLRKAAFAIAAVAVLGTGRERILLIR